MKINIDTPITDWDLEEDPKQLNFTGLKGKKTPATVRNVGIYVLRQGSPDNAHEKMKLARKLFLHEEGKECFLEASEIDLIKRCIPYPPLMFTAYFIDCCIEALDPSGDYQDKEDESFTGKAKKAGKGKKHLQPEAE